MSELTTDNALRLGAEAYKSGRFHDADYYYTLVLKAIPDHPEANHNMGVLAITVGQPESSIPFFRKAVEKNKNVEKFWISLVNAYIKLGKFEDAKSTLKLSFDNGLKVPSLDALNEKLKNLDHSSSKNAASDDLKKIVILFNQRDYETVIEMTSALLEKNNKSPLLQNICGASNAAIGRYEAAIRTVLAIESNPSYADAHNNLGIAKQKMGKFEEAITSYEDAISKKPDFAQAYNNLGALLVEMKDYKRAISILNQAIEIKRFNRGFYKFGYFIQKYI